MQLCNNETLFSSSVLNLQCLQFAVQPGRFQVNDNAGDDFMVLVDFIRIRLRSALFMSCTLNFLSLTGNSEQLPFMVSGNVTAIAKIQDFGEPALIWEGSSTERKTRKQAKLAKKKRKTHSSRHDSSGQQTKKYKGSGPKYDFAHVVDLGIGIIEAPPDTNMHRDRPRAVSEDSSSISSESEPSEVLAVDDVIDDVGDSCEEVSGTSDQDQDPNGDENSFSEVDAIFSELGFDDANEVSDSGVAAENPLEHHVAGPAAGEDEQGIVEDQGRPPNADLLDIVRGPRVAEERFILADRLGEIRYNVQGDFFRAHCPIHEGCHRRRTASISTRSTGGQGRPLGLLAHWLFSAASFGSKQDHMGSFVGNLQERKDARARLVSMPHAEHFTRHERRRQPGEDEEPAKIP